MMYLLYTIISTIAFILILPLQLFKKKTRVCKRWFRERFAFYPVRKKAPPELSNGVYSNNKSESYTIWLHAVSVGEVIASIPLINRIKQKYPSFKILVSTITDTGNSIAMEKAGADKVIYLPVDIPFAIKRAVMRFDPRILILMETEIWPNLVKVASEKSVSCILLNGRLSPDSFKGYRKIKPFMAKVLNYIYAFGMQSGEDAKRIIELGAIPKRVSVMGNIKFDQNPSIQVGAIDDMKDMLKGRKIFIAGSTHNGEDEVVINTFLEVYKNNPTLLLILAPRHIQRVEKIESLIKEHGLRYVKRTDMIRSRESGVGSQELGVILLDTLGELGGLYSLADIVFIGGSFVDAGGHNVMEPAFFSKPVIFGPSMYNFRDAADILLKEGAAIQVKDHTELAREVGYLLDHPEIAFKIGEAALKVVQRNMGATEKAIRIIQRFLVEPEW